MERGCLVILQGVEIQIEVELDGQEEAEIVYGALKPEIKSSPSLEPGVG